jgi:dehydrogenase/reductase SDR family member 7B
MNNEVIWITGASSGIGKALTNLYAKRGASLIISSRNEQELNAIKASSPNPDKINVLPLDLENQENFPSICATALAAFGQIDVLINNGGISQRSLAAETQLEVDRRLMEINFFGTIALTKALLPYFVSRKKGHFVVVSSLVGKFGSPFRSAYAASKHALHGFFDSLRAEQVSNGIKITMVCPGFIRTQVSVNALTGDGAVLGLMDEAQENGMKPEACAEAIASAIQQGKHEVLIGGREIWGVHLKNFFPGIFNRLISKVKVR